MVHFPSSNVTPADFQIREQAFLTVRPLPHFPANSQSREFEFHAL
jgi:hypothetical protein